MFGENSFELLDLVLTGEGWRCWEEGGVIMAGASPLLDLPRGAVFSSHLLLSWLWTWIVVYLALEANQSLVACKQVLLPEEMLGVCLMSPAYH